MHASTSAQSPSIIRVTCSQLKKTVNDPLPIAIVLQSVCGSSTMHTYNISTYTAYIVIYCTVFSPGPFSIAVPVPPIDIFLDVATKHYWCGHKPHPGHAHPLCLKIFLGRTLLYTPSKYTKHSGVYTGMLRYIYVRISIIYGNNFVAIKVCTAAHILLCNTVMWRPLPATLMHEING